MLVLGRMEGERLFIGDDIEIEILEIRQGVGGGKRMVRLGLTAPKELPITRDITPTEMRRREQEKQQEGK